MTKNTTEELYQAVCEDMRETAFKATGKHITDEEAAKAADNLIGFIKTLRDIKLDQLSKQK